MSTITVMPLGICHPAWDSGFYPEDLPDCWKLSYFANEFSTACLTAKDIEILSSEAEDFAENLPDDFRCILFVEGKKLPQVSDTFFDHIKAVFVIGNPSPIYLQKLQASYGRLVKVYSLMRGRLPLCHTFDVHAQLHCYIVSIEQARDLNALKSDITKWLTCNADETIVMVDSGTDIVLFRNVTTLVSLLT